jgi:predicted amidohydrolase
VGDTVRIGVLVAQFPVSLDMGRNLESIVHLMACAREDDLIILPEGALSGYAEDAAFLQEIDVIRLAESLHFLAEEAKRRKVHLIFGSCLKESEQWYNAGVYNGPRGERFVYRKINLATSERGHFTEGSKLGVIEAVIGGHAVKLGIQLCREIRFPGQWQYLARAGAEVFAYLTNAVGDESGMQAGVWRSHLVSRGAENQRFVLAVNNAAEGQKCPSMIVAPDGEVLWEVLSASMEMKRCELDLSEVSDWYLSQAREDVVGFSWGGAAA